MKKDKIDFSEEMIALLMFAAETAMEIRAIIRNRESKYWGMPFLIKKTARNDIYWLSETLHYFEHLSNALKSNNSNDIELACNIMLDRLKGGEDNDAKAIIDRNERFGRIYFNHAIQTIERIQTKKQSHQKAPVYIYDESVIQNKAGAQRILADLKNHRAIPHPTIDPGWEQRLERLVDELLDVIDHPVEATDQKSKNQLISNEWIEKAYPLQKISIQLQGTRHSASNHIINQIETVSERIRNGDIFGEEHDDDFGYRFAVELASQGPSFFDSPAGMK